MAVGRIPKELDSSHVTIDPEFKALIPALKPEERKELERSILEEGCRDPLVVWDGYIIDGHNRYEICTEHGLPFRAVSAHESLQTKDDVKDWIERNQLARRNLTADQFRYLLGHVYNRRKKAVPNPEGIGGKSGKSVVKSQIGTQQTADVIAEEFGVSKNTVKRAAKFAEQADADPEIKQAVMGGENVKKVQHQKRRAAIKEKAVLPDAKYRVIYADPPWKYADKCSDGAVQSGGVETHYPTMSIAELCQMPIKEICEDNAVLFLWVTSPLLFECAPIIEAWGFKYKTSFIWDKVKHNMGHYNSVRHEFLLVCTRGSCTPDNQTLVDSVQSIERTKHSEKPETFREIIDSLYKHGKRIELFARKKVDGWDAYGNAL
jgi:N6-adenosine-specific RNA methylase IME4